MSATASQPTSSQASRKRALPAAVPGLRWLVGGLVLFCLLLFAPVIVAWSPLRQQILSQALPNYNGNMEIGSASLGWFSNIRLKNVQIDGLDNQPLVKIGEVKLERSLLNLLFDRSDIGKVTIVQPHVFVRMRPGGSNLEDALTEILSEKAESDTALSLIVQYGSVELSGTAGAWQIDSLTGSLVPPTASKQLTAQLTGNIKRINTAQSGGNFQLKIAPNEATAESTASAEKTLHVQLLASSLPLDITSPIFERWNVAANVQGTISAKVSAHVARSGGATVSVDNVQLDNLALDAPTYLADQLRIRQVKSSGQVQLNADQILVSAGQMQCDFASGQVSGALPRDLGKLTSIPEARAWLQAHSLNASVAVNLARLSAALPQTLAFRQDTAIQNGLFKIGLQTAVANGDNPARTHVAVASLTDVVAVRDGNQITAAPIRMEAQVTDTGSELLLSKLTGDASFMQLRGQGSAESGKVELETQLGQLRTQLAQFVNLGSTQLAGTVTGSVEWATQDQQFQLKGRGQGTGIAVQFEEGVALQEPQVEMSAVATGTWNVDRTLSISQGQFDIATQTDEFHIGLVAPMGDVSQLAADLQFTASGTAASWLGRLQTLAGNAEPFKVAGSLAAAGLINATPDSISLANCTVDFNDFQLISEHLVINEPLIKIATAGKIQFSEGHVLVPQATYSSSAVAARVENLQMQLRPIVASGVCQLRGDASKIVQMLPAISLPSTQVTGHATAVVELTPATDHTKFSIEAHLAPLQIAHWQQSPANPSAGQWQTLIDEQDTFLVANGTLKGLPIAIRLEDSKLSSSLFMATASGEIVSDNTNLTTNLQGKVAYDLNRLSSFAKPYLPLSATAVGQGEQPWKLVAVTPLGTPEDRVVTEQTRIEANAAVAWTAASVEGLAVGPGKLNITGQQQRISLSAGDIPLGQGIVHLATLIDWETEQGPRATLPAGRMIQQVNLTKEACRGWLKYAAPLTSEATEITGNFSVDWTEPLIVPLQNPRLARGKGVMTVHAAKLAPSPFGQRLIVIARQIEAAVTGRSAAATASTNLELNLPAQQIIYTVQDGRVWHEGFRATVGDVIIQTKGSVGFDQTLEMVAEVPIQDAWISSGKLPASLRGQTLQLPIRGTFENPKIDDNALQGLVVQGAAAAAQGLINQQLERGLNKLFGPRTQPAPATQP
jgi:translocation and assembly module TamB